MARIPLDYYDKVRNIDCKPVETGWVLQWPFNWREKGNSLGIDYSQIVKCIGSTSTEINRVRGRQHSWKWRKAGHSVYLILKQMVQGLIPCVGTQNTSGYNSFGRRLNNKTTLHKELEIFRFPMLSCSQVRFVLSLEDNVYRVTLTSRLRLTCYSSPVLWGFLSFVFSSKSEWNVKITHHFWQRKVAAGFKFNLLFVTNYVK